VSVVLNFPRNKFGGITESIGYVRLRFSRDSIFDDLLTDTLRAANRNNNNPTNCNNNLGFRVVVVSAVVSLSVWAVCGSQGPRTRPGIWGLRQNLWDSIRLLPSLQPRCCKEKIKPPGQGW